MRFVMILLALVAACSSTPAETVATTDTAAAAPDVAAEVTAPAADPGAPELDAAVPPACNQAAVATAQSLGNEAASAVPGRNHATSCGRIVWATPEGGLTVYDTATGATGWLLPNGSDAKWPAIDGNRVAASVGTPPQIQMRALGGADWTTIEPTGAPQLRPRVSSEAIAWEDERTGRAQIRVHTEGKETWIEPTDADQRFVALGEGGQVVWTDFRDDANKAWDGDGSDDTDLWSQDGVLVQAPHKQAFAELDGDRIVWMDWRNLPRPEPKLVGFEVWTGTLSGGVTNAAAIAEVTEGSYHALPTIAGTRVAWEGKASEGGQAILGLDLAVPGAKAVPLTPAGSFPRYPVLSDEVLLFVGGQGLQVAPIDL